MREISADSGHRNQSDAGMPGAAPSRHATTRSRARRSVWLASMAPMLLAAPEDVAVDGQFDIMSELAHPLLLAVVFTLIGLSLFAASLWLIVRIAPFSIRKEIEEDQNTSLGIIIGSIILGIAMILSAAMLG